MLSSGAYQSPGWNSHDLVVSNTRASRFYHLKLEEGELNDAYSHSMLNFRLFMSDFRLLLRLGFNCAISQSLRVKEQVVQSIFLQEHKPINGYSKSCGVSCPMFEQATRLYIQSAKAYQGDPETPLTRQIHLCATA